MVFGQNIRGLSFEIEATCRALGTPVKCGVVFGRSNNSIVATTLGPSNRKSLFEPNPDIAGIGVSHIVIYLFSPSFK